MNILLYKMTNCSHSNINHEEIKTFTNISDFCTDERLTTQITALITLHLHTLTFWTLIITNRLSQGWGTCDTGDKWGNLRHAGQIWPASEFLLPKLEHNATSKRKSKIKTD